MKKFSWKKIINLILIISLSFGICRPFLEIYAAENTLSLANAKKIALAGSDSYRKIKSKITLKRVSYAQAVKAAKLNEKNEKSFRWSPLVSLRLPEEMNFAEESILALQPVKLQTELKQLEKELQAEVHNVYEETSQSFLQVYIYQEKIALGEQQLEEAEQTLKKQKGRFVLGLVSKEEIENTEEEIQTTRETLVQDKKSFILEKGKLGKLLNLDVSTGYVFDNPSIEDKILREALDEILQYALENNKEYYEAKLWTQLALLQLEENFILFEKQYGSDLSIISMYIQQVINGEEIDENVFKESYDEFLKKIEEGWDEQEKIMAISIEKEWMRSETSGIRYIEDAPYALYENVLEYLLRKDEQEIIKEELEAQVRECFEVVVTTGNEYLKQKKSTEKIAQELPKEQILNSLGQLSFEEYMQSQKEYRIQRMAEIEALEDYSALVFAFDRLTCGAVSEYLKNSELLSLIGQNENVYVVEEEKLEGAKYYIQSLVENQMFEFGIYLPKDFETAISHYELLVDGQIIGKKTEINKTLRHLTLTLKGEEAVLVRLYSGNDLVEECKIDPFSYQGDLDIKSYLIKKADVDAEGKRSIGTFEIFNREEKGLMELVIKIDASEQVCYYGIQNKDGKDLISEDAKVENGEKFLYFYIPSEELENMKVSCYDNEKSLKYMAFFDTKKYEIYVTEKQ